MALGGRIGVGNIAGVAAAIYLGGPGALFWMWVTAILGAPVALVESSLAQLYKHKVRGEYRGGPAYYILEGLGRNWRWLAVAYAAATVFATVFTGPQIQANAVTAATTEAWGWDPLWVGPDELHRVGHAAAPDEPRAPAALRRGARARRRDPHRRGGAAGPELAQGAAHRARRPRAARHLRLSPGLPPAPPDGVPDAASPWAPLWRAHRVGDGPGGMGGLLRTS